jgi:hypothetical protein
MTWSMRVWARKTALRRAGGFEDDAAREMRQALALVRTGTLLRGAQQGKAGPGWSLAKPGLPFF